VGRLTSAQRALRMIKRRGKRMSKGLLQEWGWGGGYGTEAEKKSVASLFKNGEKIWKGGSEIKGGKPIMKCDDEGWFKAMKGKKEVDAGETAVERNTVQKVGEKKLSRGFPEMKKATKLGGGFGGETRRFKKKPRGWK